MKDAYYFSHDANARNDEKMLTLRSKYDWWGVGLFWGIIEILRESTNYEFSSDALAGLGLCLNVEEAKLKTFVEYCVSTGLLKQRKSWFYSESLKRRMNMKDEQSQHFREAGRLGGLATQAKLKRRLSDAKASKVKESKVKNIHTSEIIKHFNSVCRKNLAFTKEREGVIEKCLNAGRSVDQIKAAINNFSKDDWAERHKFCDLIYAIGMIRGVDNFDKWVSYKKKGSDFHKP